MTAEDHIKRVKFAKYMNANYSQEIWTEGIAFYLDGTGFAYKRNPLDQARAPKARVWRKKTDERTNSTLIKLCRRSPDLAVIENAFPMVSRMLKRQALQQQLRRATFEQFKNRVISTFHPIPVETVNNLIRSMRKRIDMVIRNKGKRIKY